MPYAISGNLWPTSKLVTLSFQPDGTDLGGVSSNLFSTFNARFGSATVWQDQILKAAQTWAQRTDLNFSIVGDNGAPSGSGSYQQGDPGFGDIRIGGYRFGNPMLASAVGPPPANNYSIAGDIAFNTGQSFNIGSTYDLYTVALHEIGHALGLWHSTQNQAVMYSAYSGTKFGLASDDYAGIRAIYSAGAGRSPDRYDAVSLNDTFVAATDLNSTIDVASMTSIVTGLDIKPGDIDYYRFTVPSGSGSTLQIQVQSTGFSLLAPSLVVYDGSQVQLGSAASSGWRGNSLIVTVTGVTAGKTYYFKVAGADTSVFGTGRYGVALNFGTAPPPVILGPNTMLANGSPLSGGGGIANGTYASTEVNSPTGKAGRVNETSKTLMLALEAGDRHDEVAHTYGPMSSFVIVCHAAALNHSTGSYSGGGVSSEPSAQFATYSDVATNAMASPTAVTSVSSPVVSRGLGRSDDSPSLAHPEASGEGEGDLTSPNVLNDFWEPMPLLPAAGVSLNTGDTESFGHSETGAHHSNGRVTPRQSEERMDTEISGASLALLATVCWRPGIGLDSCAQAHRRERHMSSLIRRLDHSDND